MEEATKNIINIWVEWFKRTIFVIGIVSVGLIVMFSLGLYQVAINRVGSQHMLVINAITLDDATDAAIDELTGKKR